MLYIIFDLKEYIIFDLKEEKIRDSRISTRILVDAFSVVCSLQMSLLGSQ